MGFELGVGVEGEHADHLTNVAALKLREVMYVNSKLKAFKIRILKFVFNDGCICKYFFKPHSTLMAITGVTNVHGPSPQCIHSALTSVTSIDCQLIDF